MPEFKFKNSQIIESRNLFYICSDIVTDSHGHTLLPNGQRNVVLNVTG